jgi:L-ascorbate metabolism protein UlaG (beta-lactamase superfamily)
MSDFKAKIYYIYHSGFAVETKEDFLIFDYYKEPEVSSDTSYKSLLSPENIRFKKNIFIFSSHRHADHFNRKIFDLENYNSEIQYILSKDIRKIKPKANYNFISKGEELLIKNIYVKAFGSTDIGVSFLVKVDGITIFHAGDLNWWYWKEDSLANRKNAESEFKKHIESLIPEKPIDIAFFPVDPRLEEFYYIGAQYFAEKIHPKLLVPMHFLDDLSITKEFAEKMKAININSPVLHHFGEEILFME